MDLDRQRIDKWLWHARAVRTRTAAAELVTAGHVRVNGVRVVAASRPVRAGDVLTVTLDRIVRIMEVADFAERRGPPEAAQKLYRDLSPPAQPRPFSPAPIVREPGEGRPTKRDRRLTDRLRPDAED